MHIDSKKALDTVRESVPDGSRIGFVSGNFNVVHPGHLRLFQFASDCSDFLVVGVNSQRSEGTVVAEHLRLEGVQAIDVVDYAFQLRDAPEEFVATLQPQVVVKGKEHEHQDNPEQAAVEAYGGHLRFSSGEVVFSSLDLLRGEFSREGSLASREATQYLERHGHRGNDLRAVLERFRDLRVLVVGDLIVDEYVSCEALGMSQEDPTIVVTPVLNERFVGGAGIVAGHASGLGATTRLVTVMGDDDIAAFTLERLASYGIETHCVTDESRPTTLKQRYRSGGNTLLRVSHLKQHEIEQDLQQRFFEIVVDHLEDTDLLIFSDFNYGCLPPALVEMIVTEGRRRGISMVADSQSSSQVGDIARFRGMRLLTPTEREARLALRDFNSGLVVIADMLCEKADAENVILTMGPEGLLVYSRRRDAQGLATDQLPALNSRPKDTAGAGDSLLIVASMALAAGADIWQSSYLGSLASACQVGRTGNIPLTVSDLLREIGD